MGSARSSCSRPARCRSTCSSKPKILLDGARRRIGLHEGRLAAKVMIVPRTEERSHEHEAGPHLREAQALQPRRDEPVARRARRRAPKALVDFYADV
jgi:hypothetical protein